MSSNIGLTYSKPQARNEEEYGDLGWHDCYGRYQINGTLNYNKNKFNGMLSGNFVGHRISNTATERNIKPQFFTDLDLSYKPEDNHKIFFHLNNILIELILQLTVILTITILAETLCLDMNIASKT